MLKNRLTRFLCFCFFCLVFLIVGCGPTIEGETKRILKNQHKMTEEEASVGASHALRYYFAEKDENGNLVIKSEDGDKCYPIDYSTIPVHQKIDKLKETIDLINTLRDERNLNPGLIRYLKNFPDMIKRVERQKIAYEWQLGRYTRVERYIDFLKKLGLSSFLIEKNSKLKDGAYVGNVLVDLKKDLVFKPKYFILAEKDGRISFLEKIVMDWDYELEKDNPDYPEKDPTHKTIWEKKKVKLLFQTIDINDPVDNKADCILVYRLNEAGEPEEYPVISVFHPINSSLLKVALIDADKSGNPSFGVPDSFKDVYNVKKGSDLISSYRGLIDEILNPSKDKNESFAFTREEMKVFLTKPGESAVVREEINNSGWKVPISYKFVSNTGINNYQVFIKYKKEKGDDDKKLKPKKIEWIAFKYHSPDSKHINIEGRVVEFFKPQKEYDLEFTKITVEDKEIVLFPKGKAAIQLLVSTLKKKNPYRIDYDFGERRMTIEDKNDDGVYTAKRWQAKPTDIKLNEDASPYTATSTSSTGGNRDNPYHAL